MEEAGLCSSSSSSSSRSSRRRVGVKCGRWNPTGEQVKVLMDLFSAGLRTPSTEQIQKISSHLSSFGKIENKNVFYWFQNHKARERHHHHHNKKRRRPPPPPTSPLLLHTDHKELISITKALPAGISWNEEGKMMKREEKKKTLELFPLTSSNYDYDYDVVGADQYKATTRNSPLRNGINGTVGDQLNFLDDVIEPPLDLTLGFF